MSRPNPETFWNERYAEPAFAYGDTPNAFLMEHASLVRPGSRWFVPGDGEGRNGVALAALGASVTSVDLSEVGAQKARALAAARGTSIDAKVGDLAMWAPDDASYDGVASIFVHLPPATREAFHRRIVRALRPGGVLLLEAFAPAQLAEGLLSGGPRVPELLFTTEMLLADFAGLTHVSLTEERVTLDEGTYHRGPAAVVRAVFRREGGAQ